MEIKNKSTSDMMGNHRRKLLESADWSLQIAARIRADTGTLSEYRSVEALLDAFEFTVDAGSEAKKELMIEKEMLNKEKEEAKQKYFQYRDRLGHFERQDIEKSMEDNIEINLILKRLKKSWLVANDRHLLGD